MTQNKTLNLKRTFFFDNKTAAATQVRTFSKTTKMFQFTAHRCTILAFTHTWLWMIEFELVGQTHQGTYVSDTKTRHTGHTEYVSMNGSLPVLKLERFSCSLCSSVNWIIFPSHSSAISVSLDHDKRCSHMADINHLVTVGLPPSNVGDPVPNCVITWVSVLTRIPGMLCTTALWQPH